MYFITNKKLLDLSTTFFLSAIWIWTSIPFLSNRRRSDLYKPDNNFVQNMLHL